MPQSIRDEYTRKINEATSEEVVQIFKCLQCRSLNVARVNVFELLERRELECNKCGHTTPLKACFNGEFIRTFTGWAKEGFIPRNLMPIITKLHEGMSIVTCNVQAHRNIVIKGSATTITGKIIPLHSMVKITLTLVDPKGNKSELSTETDDKGEYAITYRFDECGKWKLQAYWTGDNDHYGSCSKEVTVLVYEYQNNHFF